MDKTPGIRPRPGLRHWLDVVSRYAFPGIQTALLILLLAAPIGIPGQAAIQLAWAMACIFFWSLYRPASMPAPLVFLLGLLLDLLMQGPIGVITLMLLLIHATTLRLRRWLTRSGFVTVWMVFTALAVSAILLQWMLVCALTWTALSPWPGLLAITASAGLYPMLALYLIALHRGLAAPERAA